MPSRLYCVGGKSPSKSFRITEYNSSKQKWNQVYGFQMWRLNFGITSIGSRIYMMGGEKSRREKHSLEMFDCQTGTFERLKRVRLKNSYSGCALAAVGNTLFVTGEKIERFEPEGRRDSLTDLVETTRDVHYCDLTAEKPLWRPLWGMPTARAIHTMVEHRGKLYCVGCENGTIDQYNPVRDEWFTVGDIQKQHDSSVTAALNPAENVIYVLGESFFEIFPVDGNGNNRVGGPPMQLPPNSRTSSLVYYDGKLLAIGGCLPGDSRMLTTVSEFDTRNRKWLPFPGLDLPRKRHSSVVVNY